MEVAEGTSAAGPNLTDPSDRYFLTHCFVCKTVAKPGQVIKLSCHILLTNGHK